MLKRPKIALYWCAGCGGCEESVIDLADFLLDVADQAQIVFWPVAMDARYRDVEALTDGEIDATLINGAIRLDEHVHMVRLLRRKSKCVIAHGACAQLGGVVGLANLSTPQELLDRAYRQVPSMATPADALPGEASVPEGPALPKLLPAVRPLDQIVGVEASIPGCPPTPETMALVIADIIAGRLPEPGTVYAKAKALCHECPRLDSKPERITLTRFNRLHEIQWDPEVCFLPQGLICLGPVTRGGCMARCIGANMPCRGCFGPTPRMEDFGAGAVSFIAALIDDADLTTLQEAVDSIIDPTGLFYRYCLATSVLGRGRKP